MKKLKATVLFSNLVTQPTYNGQASGKYELTVVLDETQAADAEALGISYTTSDYNGQTQHKAKFKTKYQLPTNKVRDRQAMPFVDTDGNLREIPRGSEIIVFATCKPYTMMGKSGVTNYLQGVQVINESGDLDFEVFEEPEMDNSEEVPFDGEY